MKIFRIVFAFMLASLLVASWYSTYVFYDVEYNDPRFEPANKLHAGCVQTMLVWLQNSDPIEELYLNLKFDPQDLQIIRLMSQKEYKNSFNSKFSYDTLSVHIKNIYEQWNLDLFEMYFRSEIDVTSTKIELDPSSYYIVDGEKQYFWDSSILLEFASVLECEPDMLPPSISLIHPKKTDDVLPLDSYFIFEFKDLWKWVNKDSLSIIFDWITYSGVDSSLKWSWNFVSLYPNEWLPINSDIWIKVKISDKQKYWWANYIEKNFNFKSASGLLFENPVDPYKFRAISDGVTLLRADKSECNLLQSLYKKSDIYYKFRLKKILRKMSCDIPLSYVDDDVVISWDNNKEGSNLVEIKLNPTSKAFSVFAVLWWILFAVTLMLKLHYLHHYRKHKRAIRKLKKN